MDRRNIRVGDWVYDDYTRTQLRAGANEIQSANLFSSIPLGEKFLRTFRADVVMGKKIHYKNEDSISVAVEHIGEGLWRLSIHTKTSKVETIIRYVNELQHFLADCHIYWEL